MSEIRITGSAYSLNEAEVAERNKRIWKLRLAHKTQAEIAEEVGLSQSQISRILDEMAKTYASEEVGTYLEMQIKRLEIVAEQMFNLAQAEYHAHGNGRLIRDAEGNILADISPNVQAMAKYMDALKEVNKLRGLYAPEKKEVTGRMEVTPDIMNLINKTKDEDNE